MAIEHTEVFEFLAGLPPFDRLTEVELSRVVKQLISLYVNQTNQINVMPPANPALYVVRSAVFDQLDTEGGVVARLEHGDTLGQAFALGAEATLPTVQVRTDGLVYRLPSAALRKAMQTNAEFAAWFTATPAEGLLQQADHNAQTLQSDWTQQRVSTVLERGLVAIDAERSIVEAAQRMAADGVSCLPVMANQMLVGLITDRDLRNRVLAATLDPARPVRDIMTPEPSTIGTEQTLFDALVLMSQRNIHHLPVLDAQRGLMGVLTTTDLVRLQRHEPLVFIKALHKASTRAELVAVAAHLPLQIRSYAHNAHDVASAGQLLSAITDTLTRRLLSFWQEQQGPAPAAFAWLAFGSQAREDQTLFSDQDNGLLLADDVTPAGRAWFAEMATFVCAGLGACGIPLCTGNIMAMNPRWCMTARQWTAQFSHWVDEPSPDSVLHCMIFFDSRCISGDENLYRTHRTTVAKLGQQQRFLALVAGHVANLPVPLGLFDRLRTETPHGQPVIDLKTHAIAVLNDIVRVHALHEGITACSTPKRLTLLFSSPSLARSDLLNVLHAWQFLATLRLRWQTGPDLDPAVPNGVRPDLLSGLQRQQLKEALRVIKLAQRGVAQTYRMGY